MSEEKRQHIKEYKRKWAIKHKERLRKKLKEWKANNPEKVKAYRQDPKNLAKHREYTKRNRASIAAWDKKYREENKVLRCTWQATRIATQRNAILPDSDKTKINSLYKKCAATSLKTTVPHNVDHIIPLSLGGAHHQDNMRIITAEENMTKNGKYIPELGGVWANNNLAKVNKKKLLS